MNPALDTAAISALILLLVQLFALPYIPQGPRQNAIIRGISTVLGGILVPLATLPYEAVTVANVETAVVQGLLLGGGLTYAVAAAKAAPTVVQTAAAKVAAPSGNTPAGV